MELIVFKVNGTSFGIRTESINTIIKRIDITENAVNTIKCIKGTIPYMDKVIPVIDITEYLYSDIENSDSDNDTFIICTNNNTTLAFITKGVDGIISIKQSDIMEVCSIIKDIAYMIDGFVKKESTIVSILNTRKIAESL